jgi:hypothetical protein
MSEIVDVGNIMSGSADINKQNELRNTYIHLGQYADNLNNPEHIQFSFDEKISIMNQELFKKEE